MISVSEAERLIQQQLVPVDTVQGALEALESAVLAENIYNQQPLPPFDRVAMDGIAIDYQACLKGQRQFAVQGLQAAGQPQSVLSDASLCIEVMTGAILPLGCDTVIPYEDLEYRSTESGFQLLPKAQLKAGQHIHRRGSDYPPGSCLLSAGIRLYGPQWAVLAAMGNTAPQLALTPAIAVISTGNELVPAEAQPLAHQIRISNSYQIQADLKARGFEEVKRYHLADEPEALKQELARLLNRFSILILSGGVSMGKFDFLPQILEELGVNCLFHKIAQKPGKPMWFGKGLQQQLVFALPGNPVSTAICLHRYVLPALEKMLGLPVSPRAYALLQQPITFKKPLTQFIPVKIRYTSAAQIEAWPLSVNGSGDFVSLACSDGFIEAQPETFIEQEAYPLWLWKP